MEASDGVLGASSAVFRPSWASWTDRSAIRGLLGQSWGSLGALLARLGFFLGPGTRGFQGKGLPFDSITTLVF